MIEGVSLFLVGIGALLVSIASMFRMARLAVIIPMLIAAGAGFWFLILSRRGLSPAPSDDAASERKRARKTEDKIAA